MRTSTRVVINSIILYIKVVFSLAIALISVPLILKALGASDYGLFSLVAGIVAMLSFLNNSMTVSSQRFLSVAMGEMNNEKIIRIYNTSFILHFGLGLLVAVVLELIGFFAIDKLNILPERMWCAKIIYQFLILSTFSKIIAVPFDALLNANEDMLPLSVIELIDSVLMLFLAFSLTYMPGDKLIFYGLGVAIIAVLTLFAKYFWCAHAYKECKINLIAHKGGFYIKEMLGFSGWNLFAGVAMIGRNQGVAIIINIFLGTIINAAYGIANQINGALSHFSSTFQKAINPQLMKSEGMNNRIRMIYISFVSSKFSVLALAFFAVPLIIEMDVVLSIWLKNDIPPYTMSLAQLILLLSIVYQYSTGIMSAIQATGRIRNYQITMGLILLTNIPIAYIILKHGYPVYFLIIAFILLEILALFIRLLMAKRLTGMKCNDYCKDVVIPTLLIIFIPTTICLIPHFLIAQSISRLVVVCIVYCSLFIVLLFKIAIDEKQRTQIRYCVNHLLKRS